MSNVLSFGVCCLALYAFGQPSSPENGQRPPTRERVAEQAPRAGSESISNTELDDAVVRSIELLLGMQESLGGVDSPKSEWPYEGVYRVGGQIPIGYRVGGTAISAICLLRAPGYADDAARQAAVARAALFVCEQIQHPLMSFDDYDAGYDVRAWGYCYGLQFLLEFKQAGHVDATLVASVEKATQFYLQGLVATEIPEVGGWNYARPAGKENVGPPSSFMTPAVLQTLFFARASGYEVDQALLTRALDALERGRLTSGAYAYAGRAQDRSREGVPGSIGRMVIAETTLCLAKRGDMARLRGSIDAFITHWQWLNDRRAKSGTHVAPYGVAPYYFYFGHYYAAQAVEQLPQQERAEYRRRLNLLLFSVRQEDGTWNDRVFVRSANFGTAMATMAILMPKTKPPATMESRADAVP